MARLLIQPSAVSGQNPRQLHGSKPPSIKLTTEEQAASKKIPVNATSLEVYFTNRDEVRVESELHALMEREVCNFVDGQRSYYDIYKAVRAESLTPGSWYYGTVSLEDVVNLLDAALEAEVLALK